MSIVNEIFQDMTDEEYFSLEGYYSHSLLSRYRTDGLGCLTPLGKSKALALGSLVDTLITNPTQLDMFYVVDGLSDKDIEILYELHDKRKYLCRDLTEDEIISTVDYMDWRKTWKRETRLKYINEMYEPIKDKNFEYIISTEMNRKATICVDALYTSEATKDIFDNSNTKVFQGVILGEIDAKLAPRKKIRFKARSKFDIVLVDEVNKIIYPYDLKTTSKKEWEFVDSFFKFGYDIQASLYITLLKQKLKSLGLDNEWTVEPFRFIYVNIDTPDPIVYEFDPLLTGTGFKCKPDNYHELLDPSYLVYSFEDDIKNKKRNSRPYEWKGIKKYNLNVIFNLR